MFKTTNQLMYPKYRLERSDRGKTRETSSRRVGVDEARSHVTSELRSKSCASSQKNGGLENRLADYTPTKPVQPTQQAYEKPVSRETPPNHKLDLAVNIDKNYLNTKCIGAHCLSET